MYHALGRLGGVVHVRPRGRRGEPGLGPVGARGLVLPAGRSQRLAGQVHAGEEGGLVDVVGRVLGVLKLGTVEVGGGGGNDTAVWTVEERCSVPLMLSAASLNTHAKGGVRGARVHWKTKGAVVNFEVYSTKLFKNA